MFSIFCATIIAAANITDCFISPPSDVTVIPQEYTVHMVTSGVPPLKLFSAINCTSGNGIVCKNSYYELVNLTTETYQYSIPVEWSTDTNYTNHTYSCTAILIGPDGSTPVQPSMNTFIQGYFLLNSNDVSFLFHKCLLS